MSAIFILISIGERALIFVQFLLIIGRSGAVKYVKYSGFLRVVCIDF